MIEKIKKVVEKSPNKVAYCYGDDSISYRELWNQANFYAQLLERQGTEPVIIYGGKDIEIVVSILACLIAKRTYIPLGLCTPCYRIQRIIEITHSSLVLSLEEKKCENIEWCKLDDLKKYSKNDSCHSDSSIAYIIFTSGSTGEPKGVPISIANLNNFIQWISQLKPLCQYKDVHVLDQASFSFDLSVADFYYSLCNGHTLVAINYDISEDFSIFFTAIQKVEVMVVTPTFMRLCMMNPDFDCTHFSKLKCIYFCGEVLDIDLVQSIWKRFPNIEMINAYGPTEATSAVSAYLIEKERLYSFDRLPVGDMNFTATDIEIIDDEIVLKGSSVFSGYLGGVVGGFYLEGDTPCYRTGDIGYIRDHFLFCKGRVDFQVKYKGYRIELNDIESNIKKLEGVEDCAVIAKYDERGNVKTIKAFVVLSDDKTSQDIKRQLSLFIPAYMVPKTIKIMNELPITINGKIDRVGLSQL